jgi:RNA polymerase sigma factor (sigma-70 family)
MSAVLSVSTRVEANKTPQGYECPPDLGPLIIAIASRDVLAFERFYEFTVSQIYGRALRIVRCRATAEEVTEDVFVQIWQTTDKFDAARSTPLGWALTICHSRSLDALRRVDKAILDADPTERLDALMHQPMTTLQDLLQTKQENAAMHAAIEKLRPEQRQIIGLAFFRGLTHSEISVESQTPIGTVKSQIRRALITLRRELGAA